MIKALFETHLQVGDLEASIAFYQRLGLDLLSSNGSSLAFMKIGAGSTYQELGLWKVAEGAQVATRHFAFEVDFFDLLHARQWLSKLGIETIGVFGLSNEEPVVHPSGSIASIYFNDPDGNELEFASRMPPLPERMKSVVPISQWFSNMLGAFV